MQSRSYSNAVPVKDCRRPAMIERLEARTLFSGWTVQPITAPLANTRMVVDPNGNLHYGAGYTNNGPFESVELARGSNAVTDLFNFPLETGATGIAIDSHGNVFYSCFYGGDGPPILGAGLLVEQPGGVGAASIIGRFGGPNIWPNGDPVLDSHGNLFGVSLVGGIYELPQGGSTITTLYTFGFNAGAGTDPNGLLMGVDGILYGTTASGGIGGLNSGNGIVFQFNPATSAYKTIGQFNGANGSAPNGGMVLDSSGNLFGTTLTGGSHGLGTAFEIVHGTHTIKTLVNFNGANGSSPVGGLISDSFGNLYGATNLGGSVQRGTIFEIPQGSNTIETLTDFSSNAASMDSHPKSLLTLDANGNLYESTPGVFELTAPATRIVSYTLVNADTGKAIETLQNGATLNLAQLPIDLNVVVQVQGKPLGSVLIGLDNQPRYRLATTKPYALFGFENGKYVHGTFALGKHTLSSEGWLEPTAKTLLARGPTISFNVID